MKLQVVYIDDEADLCDVFYEQFSSDQVHIRTFTNASLALNFLKANRVDLVFTDYRMPQFTGDHLVRELGSGIPIYLITGDLSITSADLFSEILHKPFSLNRIRQILEQASKPQVGQASD